MIIVASISPPPNAAAAESSAPSSPSAQLSVVEVIGRRLAGQADDVQVVEGPQLESATRQNVAKALDVLPGVFVTPLGSRSEVLVNVRGFDSRQVPLYIDGVPVYVPYDGNIDLARLGVWDVESLRVTRAGGSVLYGPNALGGAINVVTRRPEAGVNFEARGSVTLDDSLDQQRQDAGFLASAAGEHWYVQGMLITADADFFRLPSGETYGPAEDGGRRENSATQDTTSSLKVGWRGDSGADWQLAWSRLDGEKNTPPYAGTFPGSVIQTRFWQWPFYDKESLYLIGAVPVSDTVWVRTRLFYDTFQNSLLSYDNATYTTQNLPFAFTSEYDDYSWGGTAEAEWSPAGDGSITRGILYYKRDVHRETDEVGEPWERMEDTTWSLATEHQHALTDAVTGVVGVGWNSIDARQADNNIGGGVIVPFPLEDDSALNFQGGIDWRASDAWTLGANLAHKTRFPTIKDRYSYRLGRAVPNPGLQAETAEHVELSASGALLGATTRFALFGSEVEDAIEAVTVAPTACTTPPCTQNQNVGRQRNVGAEVSLARAFPYIGNVSLDYTWLDRKNQENPDVRPVYTPRQKFRVGTRTELGERVALNVDFKAEDGRYSQTNGVRTTSGFGLLDAGLEVRLVDSLRLLVEGANLTDRRYAYDEGFYESGRTWSATFLWSPNGIDAQPDG
ncbi:MAG: TonB-dependent receptor [Gammaproteobacteria bacterium]